MEVPTFLLLFSSATASFLSINTTIDPTTIAACSDRIVLTCKVVSVDPEALKEATLSLPGWLELVREDEPSVHAVTFTDHSGAEATFSYNGHGVSGEIETDEGAMFFLEPCPEFQGCHVLVEVDMEELHKEEEAEEPMYLKGERALMYPEMRALSALQQRGINDPTTMVTYTIKVYYTTDFLKSTPKEDIPTFVDNVGRCYNCQYTVFQMIAMMNQGYINSNIPIRVALHCIEAANLQDIINADRMLHKFDGYKGSPANLRSI